ncbi:MAG: DNA-binding response OmpR family regulator [Marivirga sp.]|jgi:DNA-binding response OmpR family regulator
MKLLIIEDEAALAQDMVKYLTSEQYLCECASDYQSALEKVNTYSYDCILLDLMLPEGNGMSILSELKNQNKQAGVIIISAKDSVEDKITGLKLGADDYLAKPFHLPELSARLFSVIRRKQFNNDNKIVIGNLEVDLLAKAVTFDGEQLALTKKEYELLLFLIGNKNSVISKAALAEHLSGDMADMLDNHSFVYAHVKNLKNKLLEAKCPEYIKTVYGLGYKWEL